MGELKKIEDFRISSISRVSGSQTLSREDFDERGNSLGVTRVSHAFVPDEAAMFAACWCGLSETDEIHSCDHCGSRLEGDLAEVVRRHLHDTDSAETGWCSGCRHLVVHEPCFDRETMELA